jgi:glucokinase
MRKIIAVDLGGTNLRVSLVHNDRIVNYIKSETPKTQEELLNLLYLNISKLITKDVTGIGVGSPGPLENGIIKNPPNLPFRNFNLKKALEKKFHKKVMIENDVKCVALAELNLGVRKKDFIVIAFGTGIGGGIIVDKKLYIGRNFAGELGHLVLKDGNYFEILWQETRKKIRQIFGKDILIAELIKMKDKRAKELLDEMYDYIGMGMGSLINVFDPEVIVINGGFKEAGRPLLLKIKEHSRKYSILPHNTDIEFSKLDHPGTLGASFLVS